MICRKTYLLGNIIFLILIIYTVHVHSKETVKCSKKVIVNWWDRAPYIYGDGVDEDVLVVEPSIENAPPTGGKRAAISSTKTFNKNDSVNGNVNSSLSEIPTTAASQTTKPSASSKFRSIKSQNVNGFLKTIIERIVESCCGSDTEFVYLNSSRDVVDMKIGTKGAVINFPVNGKRMSHHFKGYPYIPLIESPAVIFLTKMPGASDTAKHVISTALNAIYILIIGMIMATITGILMWMLDSYINYDEFPKTFFQGIWKGFWWSVVTMTTVGYGDKVPKTFLARMLAIVWAYIGMVIFSVFSSAITSSLTAKSLDPDISLYGRNIVAFKNSEERNFGIKSNAKMVDVENINDFAKKIKEGEVQGGLIDSYVAGHYQEMLSEDNGYFTKNIYDYQFMYGVAISNDFQNKEMETCLRKHATLQEPDINQILAEDLTTLPTPNAAKFQKLTTSVFAADSAIFHETAATCAVIMAIILVVGFTWQFKFRPHTRPCCRGNVEPAEDDEEAQYVSELNVYENEDQMIKGQLRELEDAMVKEVLLYRQAFQKRKKDMYKLVKCEGLIKQLPNIMALDEIHFAKYSSPDIRN